MKTSMARTFLLFLLVLFAATQVQAFTLPDFEASYELRRSGLRIGTSTLSLSHDANGHYVYESRSWPIGVMSWFLKDKLHETSRGYLDDHGIRPLEYHYERSGGSKKRKAALSFDWNRMSVENSVEGSHWKMDIPEGTLDKLASQLGMMHALHTGKQDVTFNIADGGKLKEYRFRVIGTETLELPAGTFETVKLTKLRKNKKRETYIWCAPSLNYIPVRIWQREKDGSRYQSDLESFSESLRVK